MSAFAFSPAAAARQFDPPLSQRVIRKLIREKILRPIKIGRRTYLLATEIQEALEAFERV
jgi:hypothetical protein